MVAVKDLTATAIASWLLAVSICWTIRTRETQFGFGSEYAI